MSSAGHVGGAVSPTSLLSLKVSSKPNPLGPSGPVNLTNKLYENMDWQNVSTYTFVLFLCAWGVWKAKYLLRWTNYSEFTVGQEGTFSKGLITKILYGSKWLPTFNKRSHRGAFKNQDLCYWHTVLTHEHGYPHTGHWVQSSHSANAPGRPELDNLHFYTYWCSLTDLVHQAYEKQKMRSMYSFVIVVSGHPNVKTSGLQWKSFIRINVVRHISKAGFKPVWLRREILKLSE